MSDTTPSPIELTEEEARRLRDVLREAADTRARYEELVLRARADALAAESKRRAVFESLADAHGFDATDSFEFHFHLRQLVPHAKG